ncbi:MAG: hypothetical protein ACRD4B_07965 [Acidobacteriota bacterium]
MELDEKTTVILFSIFILAVAGPSFCDPVKTFEQNFLNRYKKANGLERANFSP